MKPRRKHPLLRAIIIAVLVAVVVNVALTLTDRSSGKINWLTLTRQ
jgi:hypothetical protein